MYIDNIDDDILAQNYKECDLSNNMNIYLGSNMILNSYRDIFLTFKNLFDIFTMSSTF